MKQIENLHGLGLFHDGVASFAVPYDRQGKHVLCNYGLINTDGEVVIQPKGNLHYTGMPHKWKMRRYTQDPYYYTEGVVDDQNRVIIPLGAFEHIYNYDISFYKRKIALKLPLENFIVQDFDGKFGVLNADGECVAPCIYDRIYHDDFDNLLPLADEPWDAEGIAYYSTSFENILQTPFEYVNLFRGRRYTEFRKRIGRNKCCYGLINRKGEVVVELQDPSWFDRGYDDTDQLLIVVHSNNKYFDSVINLVGEEVIPTHGHIVRLRPNLFYTLDPRKKITVVDSENRIVIPPIYRNLWTLCDGLLAARNKKGRCGVISYDGDEVIPFKYDNICAGESSSDRHIYPITEDLLIPVELRGEHYYINLSGERVLF